MNKAAGMGRAEGQHCAPLDMSEPAAVVREGAEGSEGVTGAPRGTSSIEGTTNASIWSARAPYQIVLFYRYTRVHDAEAEVRIQHVRLGELGLLGRLLIAPEGYNGTLAGSPACLSVFMSEFEAMAGGVVDWKLTDVAGGWEALPFINLSVFAAAEIISVGKEGREIIDGQVAFDGSSFGGLSGTGVHLTPEEFNRHLAERDPKTSLLLDVRNGFESSIGSFEGSLPLSTITYSQTWRKLDDVLSSAKAETPIYMYCTGGIRCEKASAYLKARGHQTVYQLQGGIHRYLEKIPAQESRFSGRNFVFDGRVGVQEDKGVGVQEDEGFAVSKGSCLQCGTPHAVYSGNVVCTVCRNLCLYCPRCVRDNPHQGEYHCEVHQTLREVYFTVLCGFTDAELEAQRSQLEEMLSALLNLPPKERIRAKNRRRTLRRQADKIVAELERRVQEEESGAARTPTPRKTRSGFGFWAKD